MGKGYKCDRFWKDGLSTNRELLRAVVQQKRPDARIRNRSFCFIPRDYFARGLLNQSSGTPSTKCGGNTIHEVRFFFKSPVSALIFFLVLLPSCGATSIPNVVPNAIPVTKAFIIFFLLMGATIFPSAFITLCFLMNKLL